MEFNPNKCKMVHFGSTDEVRTYTKNGNVLWRIVEQRVLGIQVHVAGGNTDR